MASIRTAAIESSMHTPKLLARSSEDKAHLSLLVSQADMMMAPPDPRFLLLKSACVYEV
jgi:hypothetical protein